MRHPRYNGERIGRPGKERYERSIRANFERDEKES